MATSRGDSWFDETVLDRDHKLATGAAAPLGRLAEAVMSAVDVASRVIGWMLDTPGDRLGSPLALFRTTVERTDSISCLIPSAQEQSIRVLLRSAHEAGFQLAYMLQSNTEQRDLWYRHAALIKRRRWAERLLCAKADLPTDKRARLNDMLRSANAALSEPQFANVQDAYTRRSIKRQNQPCPWYAYDDGPKGMKALARLMNEGAGHEDHYVHLSESVHADEGTSCFKLVNGVPHFEPLRAPTEYLQTAAHLACANLLLASQRMARKFLSSERQAEFDGEMIRPYRLETELRGSPIFRVRSRSG